MSILKYVGAAIGGMLFLVFVYFCWHGVSGLIDTHDRVVQIETTLAEAKKQAATDQTATIGAISTVQTSVGDVATIAKSGAMNAAQANAKLNIIRGTQLADSKMLADVAKRTDEMAKDIDRIEVGVKDANNALWGLRRAQDRTAAAVESLHFVDFEVAE